MRKRSRQFAVLALLVAVGAAAATGSAGAALFFFFSPTSAKVNDEVTVRIAGTPETYEPSQGIGSSRRSIRLYLVPNAVARDVRSRFDRRLHFIGALVPDARLRGILRFTVPPVESGGYAVAAWCRDCAAFSRGRAFSVATVGDNTVPRYRPLMLLRVTMPSARRRCPATVPNGRGPDGRHGNGFLSTRLLRGGVILGRREQDGSISHKVGWLPSGIGGPRSVLVVRGRRLDAPSPPLRVLGVNWGYASNGQGGWASAVRFPKPGCWKIRARVRDVTLSFVAKVVAA